MSDLGCLLGTWSAEYAHLSTGAPGGSQDCLSGDVIFIGRRGARTECCGYCWDVCCDTGNENEGWQAAAATSADAESSG
jgi:hypothetical protein